MRKTFANRIATSIAAAGLALLAGSASAVDLTDIFEEALEANQVAQNSQTTIDATQDQTNKLVGQYKLVLKDIDGLRVYNTRQERLITSQRTEMRQLGESIEGVTRVRRHITPLMVRMIDALDAIVENDVPFLLQERRDRVATLRDLMDLADVSESEKFRRVLEAYQIEAEFGRTLEAYEAPIPGGDQIVIYLRVGRVSLSYQTRDGAVTGAFNPTTREWEELGAEFRSGVATGIKIAQGQTAPELIRVPVAAPVSGE